ncbi:MAG: c-type cytochrome biogenesis protein CcmI [Candidatus Accumulibacter sp.]|jgi:cytochrome c-type biogenesis protein CcmH|nr:c-type cytochrome biogenesis protein CcmI [Accumulibacter sp.]
MTFAAFALAAGLLLLAVLALLLWPLLRDDAAASPGGRREANLAVLRDEMRELERARDEGALAADGFEQAKLELQRRLLEETAPEPPAPGGPAPGGRRTALALIVALPLAAVGGYALLGTPQALNPAPAAAHASAGPQEMEAMLAGLVKKLEANPDDWRGWVMLARSYRTLGRFDAAAQAYARAEPHLAAADLLAEYAEALALSKGGDFAGKPDALLARALAIDPEEPQALFVAGAAALRRQDYAAAIAHWNRVLPKLAPDSDIARDLREALDHARRGLEEKAASNEKAKP